MTERVIKETNREKQLLAEPEPINVADWDEAILNELGHTTNDDTPPDSHPNVATMDTDETPAQQPDNPAKPTTTHARQTHPAQKTKAHNKTPQKQRHHQKRRRQHLHRHKPNNKQTVRLPSPWTTSTRGKGRGRRKTRRAKGKSEVPVPHVLHRHHGPPPTPCPHAY